MNLYLYEEAENNTDYFGREDAIAINEEGTSPAKVQYKAEEDTTLYLRLRVETLFLLNYRITFTINGEQISTNEIETTNSSYKFSFVRIKAFLKDITTEIVSEENAVIYVQNIASLETLVRGISADP